jgi:drug/metabolite transporter (DMT)-like permease
VEYPKTFDSQANFWRHRQALLGEMAFVIVVAIWGITFVFSKNARQVVGPFAYNTIRMTLGAITLALLVGREWRKVDRHYVWPSLVTGLILFLSYSTQSYGQQFTTASKAGFLTGTCLVYVPIFSALLLRRVPSWTAITGVIVAFIGLYLLSIGGTIGNLSLASGDFWVALSGIGWALYVIALANYSPRLNVVAYSTLHMFVAALMSGLGWLFFEPLYIPVTSMALWVGVISTGFFILGLGTSIQTWVTRLVSPTRVALIAALEPVFAAVAGWWVGEIITLRIIIGGTLIIVGMLVAEFRHLLKRNNLNV